MEYFELRLASDPKIIGVSNGIMQVEICDKLFLENSSKRQEEYFAQSIQPFDKKLTCIKPLKRVNYTDILSFGPHLIWHPFLVNTKALNIFKKYNNMILYT